MKRRREITTGKVLGLLAILCLPAGLLSAISTVAFGSHVVLAVFATVFCVATVIMMNEAINIEFALENETCPDRRLVWYNHGLHLNVGREIASVTSENITVRGGTSVELLDPEELWENKHVGTLTKASTVAFSK